MAPSLTLARRLLAGLTGGALVVTASLAAQGGDGARPGIDTGIDTGIDRGLASHGGPRVDEAVITDLAEDGTADFWISFPQRPDLSFAAGISDWDARGQAVYDALTSTAAASQADVRADLDRAGVDYQAFSITNAIRVTGGGSGLVSSLSTDPDVDRLYAPVEITPPDDVVLSSASTAVPQAVEWGVADINADDVWATGVTGAGIVVGSIDTGVQWDHPALINQYRGNIGGVVDHNYNWFDAAGVSPSAPSDLNGHGTHVTGTMAGGVGANQIGVAPGATWVAANGCCPSDAALVASGEWMLAPLNLAGTNPSPGARPHIINNSWGTEAPSTAPFMEDIALAWAASGQFAVFANGNLGSACNTSSSPGSRAVNYSVGNHTAAHTIASTSSRGAGQGGMIKPNISAPGTSVRSAYPGNGYAIGSGTSMASPHVAGAVALLWSARPGLLGDILGTRAMLDHSAIDTASSQCGGSASNNNVFGQGRLDALGLIENGPGVVRLSGSDRYATAAAISRAAHPAGATDPAGPPTVYLASGQNYPDALVGAALAGSQHGPVLLTRPGTLPAATQTELARLGPDEVVLLGGEASISPTVRDQVAALTGATITRLSGPDRYATAGAIAGEFLSADTVYVATGLNFPDALAGAALGSPVLLTRPDSLPPAARDQLARLAPDNIHVLGGPSVVSDTVLSQLGAYGPTTRIFGENRYATAVQVSQAYAPPTSVFVATGRDWPDALTGAAMAASLQRPVLLVQQDSIPSVTLAELDRLDPDSVVILGGTGPVSAAVETQLHTLRP